MSIRPADMQIVVHKTQDIHPAKQSVVNKTDNELLMAQEKGKALAEQNQKRVAKSERSELKKVKNDDRKKRSKSKKKKQSEDDEDTSDAQKKKKKYVEPRGSKFDMKV